MRPVAWILVCAALLPCAAAAQKSSKSAGKLVGKMEAAPSDEPRLLAGVPDDAVRPLLEATDARLRGCYERAARLNPELAGSLVLVLTVDAAGDVTRAEVEDDGLGDEVLGRCLAGVGRELRFPAPEPAPATLRWSISLPLPAPAATPDDGRAPPPAGGPARGDEDVAFWTYLGAASALGVVPAAAAGLLLALPFGVFAAPLFAIVPLVGNYVAVFIAEAFSGVEAPLFFYLLPAVLALAFYPALYAVAAVPVVDQLAQGAAFPLESPALTWAGAGTLAVGLFLVGETLSLTSAAMYSASQDDEE